MNVFIIHIFIYKHVYLDIDFNFNPSLNALFACNSFRLYDEKIYFTASTIFCIALFFSKYPYKSDLAKTLSFYLDINFNFKPSLNVKYTLLLVLSSA